MNTPSPKPTEIAKPCQWCDERASLDTKARGDG